MMKNILILIQGLVFCIILMGCDETPTSSTSLEQDIIHPANHSVVQIETNYGPIWVELFDDLTPKTVENFIQYVKEDFYDDTLIHQVLPGFIIQAGLYDKEFRAKIGHESISNEALLSPKHTRGTVAMMRGNQPDSAATEFFINLKDNELFDIHNGYAVFGKVIKGMEILDKISALATCGRGPFFDDAPCEPVVIQKVVAMS